MGRWFYLDVEIDIRILFLVHSENVFVEVTSPIRVELSTSDDSVINVFYPMHDFILFGTTKPQNTCHDPHFDFFQNTSVPYLIFLCVLVLT